ncbi:hypothetical protein FHS43_000533 [Streptosporangium becharense]|uniref:Uncharacterized protein n=1 Tax=Streptosporangium becharense TaxID=1816182 RepID=A0A7W9MK69_9ACTN|nr:hypothetical protein [Streptosporangium becharense]MBB2909287.1 hypothetical protein [Streptosporangium becharense]MBB5823810.1 hypothetical protein [Streptosporangium becharense]
MHHTVLYIAEAPHRLHGRPAALFLTDSLMQVSMDREQIEKRIFGIMKVVAATVVGNLTLRDTPSDEPWGRTTLRFAEADDPQIMIPTITASGLELPVPRHLITVDLARALEGLTDKSMRFYNPPTL